MVVRENQCTGCADLGIPCLGTCCPNRNVPVMYCDNKRCLGHFTGIDRLFVVDGIHLCMDCIREIADRNGVEPEDLIEGEV